MQTNGVQNSPSPSPDTDDVQPKLHLVTDSAGLGKELVRFNQLENYYPMRVAMVQTAAGLKPPSGGYRANYATLYALSTYGHKTMQLCWAYQRDINMAVAELKQVGNYDFKDFKRGKIQLTGRENTKFEVNWWKFTDVHGVRCICLDAETMVNQLPNEIQGQDAAMFIEVSSKTYHKRKVLMLSRLATCLHASVRMLLGYQRTLTNSGPHTSFSMMHLRAS